MQNLLSDWLWVPLLWKVKQRGGVISTYYPIHYFHLGYWSRLEPKTTFYKFIDFLNLPFWAVGKISTTSGRPPARTRNPHLQNSWKMPQTVSRESDNKSTYCGDLGLSRQLSCLRGHGYDGDASSFRHRYPNPTGTAIEEIARKDRYFSPGVSNPINIRRVWTKSSISKEKSVSVAVWGSLREFAGAGLRYGN